MDEGALNLPLLTFDTPRRTYYNSMVMYTIYKGERYMEGYESFAECLKRCLKQEGVTASEAARLVGFRSRNSIFRILQGETSGAVNEKFLQSLRDALGERWPDEHWHALEQALAVDRMGADSYQHIQAFRRVLQGESRDREDIIVQTVDVLGGCVETPLPEVLREIAKAPRTEIVITGCCDTGVMNLLESCCAEAAEAGRLSVRHYIDITEDVVVRNILGVLPMLSKSWYNARLVGRGSCPEQTLQMYRLNAIYVTSWDGDRSVTGQQLTWIDEQHFIRRVWQSPCPIIQTLDRWRFHLKLLKPAVDLMGDASDFLNYTIQYAKLEDKCTILSIKPDVHFNCIPPQLLYNAVMDAFEQSGMPLGDGIDALMEGLAQVHEKRFNNMMRKRRPTHLVYSYPAMERFMHTGVMSDHFFIQRPYTVEERRELIRALRDAMVERPWFNIYFFKANLELRNEISYYGDKGVMIMAADTGYELAADHSEALITLPAFSRAFREYFMESLLKRAVTGRAETLALLDQLILLNVTE